MSTLTKDVIHQLASTIFKSDQAKVIKDAIDQRQFSRIFKEQRLASKDICEFQFFLYLSLQECLLNAELEVTDILSFVEPIHSVIPIDIIRELETGTNRIVLLFDVLPSYGINHAREIFYSQISLSMGFGDLFDRHKGCLRFFPMLSALEARIPDYRLISPLPHIFAAFHHPHQNIATMARDRPTLISVILRYLDTSRPTILNAAPASSVLRPHSEGSIDPAILWGRKTMAKFIASSFLWLGQTNLVSGCKGNLAFIEPASFSIRLARQETATNVELASAVDRVVTFLRGVRSGVLYFARSNILEISRLVGIEFGQTGRREEKQNNHLAGIILVLGLLGKLRSLSVVDILPMVLSSDGLLDATALLALAGSKPQFGDIQNLILTNLRRFAKCSDQFSLKIDYQVRLASPLAAGLLMDDQENTTLCAHLFNIIWRHCYGIAKCEDNKSPFEVDYYILHAGIGIALMRSGSLHPNQVRKMVDLICEEHQLQCHWSRAAAIFALGNSEAREEEWDCILNVTSLDRYSIEDCLLIYTVIYSLQRSPSPPSINLTSSENALCQGVAIILAMGLRALAGELVNVAEDYLEGLLDVIQGRHKVAAIDFTLRMQRANTGILLDLLLLAWSMLGAANDNVLMLQRQSRRFSENLDYCFGRAHLHTISLTLIGMSRCQLQHMRLHNHARKIKICWLATILPLPSMTPEDPVALFRLLLPLYLFQGYPLDDTIISSTEVSEQVLQRASQTPIIKEWLHQNPPLRETNNTNNDTCYYEAMLEYLKYID